MSLFGRAKITDFWPFFLESGTDEAEKLMGMIWGLSWHFIYISIMSRLLWNVVFSHQTYFYTGCVEKICTLQLYILFRDVLYGDATLGGTIGVSPKWLYKRGHVWPLHRPLQMLKLTKYKNPCFWSKIISMAKWPLSSRYNIQYLNDFNIIWHFWGHTASKSLEISS